MKEITKQRIEEGRKRVEQEIAENKTRVESLLNNADFLDDDGYPTEDALEIIEKWHWDDPKGWFKFIEGIWYLRNWGWTECEGGIDEYSNEQLDPKTIRYHISTAGWSGNESIIRAMQNNSFMWYLNWVQSRRGGHYIFELKEVSE